MGLAQQLAVLGDSVEQAGVRLLPGGGGGVDPWAALPFVVTVADCGAQPGELQHPVHAFEAVVVGDQVPQGTGDEEVFRPAFLASEQPRLPPPPGRRRRAGAFYRDSQARWKTK